MFIGVPKYKDGNKIESPFPNNVFLATNPHQVYPEFIVYFQWALPGYELVPDEKSRWLKAKAVKKSP